MPIWAKFWRVVGDLRRLRNLIYRPLLIGPIWPIPGTICEFTA